jgi:AcrR family transcriptional regulator
VAETLSARGREALVAARELLEAEGPDGLTMRALAERLGIRAPSLYKHLPDKAAIEVALMADGLAELADALEATDGSFGAIAHAYRAFAFAHPHLYRLMTERPLPRHRLPEGLEERGAAPVVRALGTRDRARAAWAGAHGLVMLELADRFPEGADLDAAWAEFIAAWSG